MKQIKQLIFKYNPLSNTTNTGLSKWNKRMKQKGVELFYTEYPTK